MGKEFSKIRAQTNTTIRPTTTKCLVGALLCFTFLEGSLTAQNGTDTKTRIATKTSSTSASNSIGPHLSQLLQNHARIALGRHLRADEFQVFVKVTPAIRSGDRIPYLPETLPPLPSVETPPENLASWITRVDVEVMISARHKKQGNATIEAILTKSLALDKGRGDTIVFSSIGLNIDPPLSEIQRELVKAEADIRDLKGRLESVTLEREETKRDLTRTKTELEQVLRTKNDGDKSFEDPSEIQLSKGKGSLFESNLRVILIAIVTLVVIFVAFWALRTAAQILGAALQTIGSSIPLLGEKISEALLGQAPRQPFLAEGSSLNANRIESPEVESTWNNAHIPTDSITKRVIELHHELTAVIDAHNEGSVLEHLSWLLDSEASVGKAVATMELLGKDKANNLFNKLSIDHQQKVFKFLRTGIHERPKDLMMLDAGETLKTRLFAAQLPSRAKFDPLVRDKLVQIDAQGLLQVARSLEGENLLARLFAYIGPDRLASLLSTMYKIDQKKFLKAADAVAKIPAVETNVTLDRELIAAFESQMSRALGDLQGPYLPYYRTLLECVDEDVATPLVGRLSAADKRVASYLRDTVVTFETFFKLHLDLQEAIISNMNNRDLAALLYPLSDVLKTQVYQSVETRRQELINDEIQRVASKGERQALIAHKGAKDQVLARIQQLKGNRPLTDLLVREETKEPTTDINQLKSPKAA